MTDVLVDSNVLLDVVTEDPRWYGWSAEHLAELADTADLVINPLIYSEVSVGFDTLEALDEALSTRWFRREPLPWAAGFLAGKCFQQYRRAGGTRRSPLPDFYIGAHAAIMEMRLLTRDARRYRSYLPQLEIISPD
ncbi:MAG: type II toxin-antitoxin system VapC family toxin [Halofilum sp. (in: g-proteobacteria)]|nr:type II toxin-antitoxin system VapC family toxin [Halofilum sp. (in: g-proteobacteria)]